MLTPPEAHRLIKAIWYAANRTRLNGSIHIQLEHVYNLLADYVDGKLEFQINHQDDTSSFEHTITKPATESTLCPNCQK